MSLNFSDLIRLLNWIGTDDLQIFLIAKCSTKNHSVSLPETISLFALYSKNLQATHT